MDIELVNKYMALIESCVKVCAVLVGGFWVYYKFILKRERYPNLMLSCDINFVGIQNDFWLIEVVAKIENKGKAQLRMTEFDMQLTGIKKTDKINLDTNFQHSIYSGSFIRSDTLISVVEPGVSADWTRIFSFPLNTAI